VRAEELVGGVDEVELQVRLLGRWDGLPAIRPAGMGSEPVGLPVSRKVARCDEAPEAVEVVLEDP
jgi:hypothetical protein